MKRWVEKGNVRMYVAARGTVKDYVDFLGSRGLEFALLIDRTYQIFIISQHNATLV